ncbi:MAG: hypothetical protein M3033_16410 [Acidobacteriota bacterium]|nr:hypothetical protein [Acidobacteriota bacterium]
MNKKTEEIRAEYDFSKGVRGKHADAFRGGHETIVHKSDGSTVTRETRPIILDADVQEYFSDAESVNQALRGLIALVPEKRN